MSIKIYLSPSSQDTNPYIVGGTNEAEQCRNIAKALDADLKRCGFEVKTGLTGSMYTRVAESNAWGADAHIPIHTNAFDGKVAGFRGFYYNKSSEGYPLVDAIMDAVAPITPGTSDGVSAYPGLYEMKASNAPCAYLELGFHDNKEEAKYIIDHTNELAVAICKGICNHYKVEYVQKKVDTSGKKLYYVQAAANSNYEYALDNLKKLKAAGFPDAFIKEG